MTGDDDDGPQARFDTSSAPSTSKLPTVPDARPRSPYEGENDNGDDSDSSFDDDDDDAQQVDSDTLPLSHEVTLKDHSKVVSALALDPSGARIASGGHDYECKLWDFGGMNASLKPFKSWEPAGSYYVGFILSDIRKAC